MQIIHRLRLRRTPLASAVVILASLNIVGCEWRSPDASASADFSIEGLQSAGIDTAAVARVGDLVITGEELYVSFEMGPGFVSRRHRDDPVRAHLDFMIYEKLMALEGLEQGLDRRAGIGRIIEEIRQDVAVTEMFRSDILDTVRVGVDEVKRAVDAATINVQFSYAKIERYGDAKALRTQLGNGTVSFNTISTRGVKNDGTNLTFWELEQQDTSFARQIREVPFGEVSGVIQTERGYFLARVDTAFRNPFITPSEYNRLLHQYEERLKRRRLQVYAFDYAADRLEAAAPVIRRKAFDALFAFMRQLQTLDTRDPEAAPLGYWPGSLDRALIEEGQPQVLVISQDGANITIRDFLDWYELRRFSFEGGTPAATANALKQIIWRMVRDRVLGREALARGFGEDPRTLAETQWWRDKLLYWEIRDALLADLVFDEGDLGSVDAANPTQDDVLRELYTFEERKFLQRYLHQRMRNVDVQVFEETLARFPRPDSTLSKPVDLFVFKKGGTFPRQAYPTIDRVWERF